MVACRLTFAQPASLSRGVAVPIVATFFPGPTPDIAFFFSENLESRTFPNIGKWVIRFQDDDYNVQGGAIANNEVSLILDQDVSTGPGDTISLSIPPQDLITLASGIPVAPFTNFPVVGA